ncbi:MAG: fatty acid desaturase [Rubrivivax sp.]|nr:fatty acid desaturase [Rubrivivax sp.]
MVAIDSKPAEAPKRDAGAPWNAARCRALVDDLREPRAAVYFLDAGLAALGGWAAFAGAAVSPGWGWALVLFAAASLLLYRGLAFIHELFHQQGLRAFRIVWHALVGVPLLLPLLLYLPIHQAHHNAQLYGTALDGEYEQFEGRRTRMTLRLLLLNLALPVALVVRFAVLTPLGALIPAVRTHVIPSFVHLSLRMPFKAPELRGATAAEARWVEIACMAWAWLLVAALFAGYAWLVGLWALLLVVIATLNTVRALCSTHLYVERDEGRDTMGQVADSLNIDGGWATQLLCPVGLQYHALHHLAPYLPYHALPQAHRRLMAQLPSDSIYRHVTVPSLYQGWRRLVAATEPPMATSATGASTG